MHNQGSCYEKLTHKWRSICGGILLCTIDVEELDRGQRGARAAAKREAQIGFIRAITTRRHG